MLTHFMHLNMVSRQHIEEMHAMAKHLRNKARARVSNPIFFHCLQ